MAKKKAARTSKKASGTPKKKKASKRSPAKKKPAKRQSKASTKKKTRKRSRGARRNKKTAKKHAINATVAASEGREHSTAVDVTSQEPPESFRPGPSVTVLDGTAPIQRDREVILAMMNHQKWQIPEWGFEAIPNRVLKWAFNMGDVKDEDGNVIQENVPDAGMFSTNQQLTAVRMLKEMHQDNLRKLTSLKPKEVRVLNEQQTTVTTEDQRLALIAAIASEIERRDKGGTV